MGKYTKEEVIGVVFSKLRPSPEDVFADIGCGSGAVAEFFAPYVKKVYAVDLKISEDVKKRLERLENVVVAEMDGREFLKNTNLIWSSSVERGVLRRCSTSAVPEGLL